ncbi:MAG: TlpA disulfide reductase family protein, partial [Bacteroidota bacterium]
TPPCRGRMQIFAMHGAGYYKMADIRTVRLRDTLSAQPELKVEEKHTFTWQAPDTEPSIYYLGTSMRDYVPIVVGQDPLIQIKGKCGQLGRSTISASPSNLAYQGLLKQLRANNNNFSELTKKYRSALAAKDEAAQKAEAAKMGVLDGKKRALVDSLKSTNPFLGRIAAVNTYLSFQGSPNSPYNNELEHYVNTFWQFTDFTDAGYNGLNAVYEASVAYTNTLASALDGKKMGDVLNAYFAKWPAGSEAQLYAMGGAFGVLSQRGHPTALPIGEALVSQFKADYPLPIKAVEQSFNKLRTSVQGAEAPDLVGNNPSGEQHALSDLRGKVVLIDFWASWCGPCRRENPNVKRIYNKYAAQGFEILGVSLDRSKDRWEKAIADDGLSWLHISDLKHWKSEHARLYGVRSIPETVLLDQEGRIIARGLRGAQLEQRLAKIFGEGK